MENYSKTKRVERTIVLCLLALVAVFAVAIYSFVALGNARRKNAEYDELVAALQKQEQSLENDIDKMKDPTHLEQLARDHYGYIKDGERYYKYNTK